MVSSLRQILQGKKLRVANDRHRDLYILENKKIRKVFEFKTDTSRQSIYTAIGQLFLNNISLNPRPELILVTPDGLSNNLQKRIKQLDIDILEYTWDDKDNPRFVNLGET